MINEPHAKLRGELAVSNYVDVLHAGLHSDALPNWPPPKFFLAVWLGPHPQNECHGLSHAQSPGGCGSVTQSQGNRTGTELSTWLCASVKPPMVRAFWIDSFLGVSAILGLAASWQSAFLFLACLPGERFAFGTCGLCGPEGSQKDKLAVSMSCYNVMRPGQLSSHDCI